LRTYRRSNDKEPRHDAHDSTLAVMMVVLILGVGGLMLAVRAIGAREVKDDHPH